MLDQATAEEKQATPETETTSLTADVLSDDARESTPMIATERSTQNDAASHGWRVLAVLSA